MKEAGFKYGQTSRQLLDLCKGTTQIGGARVAMRWWNQKGVDWEKAKTRGAET